MKRQLLIALLVAGSVTANAGGPVAAAQDDDQQISALLERVGEMLRAGDGSGYAALLDESADQVRAADFAALEFAPGVTRSVIKERGREELQGALPGTYRLTVDAFAEFGDRGRVATWQIDLRKSDANQWRVIDQAPLSVVGNLYRLSVNPAKQFDARNFTLRSEDLELTLAEGSVFLVDTDQGPTGLILLGRGDIRFHPPSDTEKGQVKIFAGAETLESRFETAYVRVGALDLHGDLAQLSARAVDARDLKRAEQVFRDESGKSFVVELDDLTADTWSLLPTAGDFLAEVRTRRFDTLTYSRSGVEPEDVSVFDREHKKTISAYASAEKLAAHGGSYNEDDLSDYDILDYDIDLSVDPERQWIEGQATLRLAIRAPFVNHLTMKLADPLAVKSVVSDEFGWLFSLRVKNQNTILVNLPVGAERGRQITLRMAYSGKLSPQAPDRETIGTDQDPEVTTPPPAGNPLPEMPSFLEEPKYLYSNRSYWYPQAPSSDYATATIQLSVPASLSCVASGELVAGSPTTVATSPSSQGRKLYQFAVTRPVRYLSFLVSRFTRSDELSITFDKSPDTAPDKTASPTPETPAAPVLDLAVEANPRQRYRARAVATQAADIARFYESIIGDVPYQSFTVALVDGALPGGHSPGYFAMLSQPDPQTPISWRNNPANFDGYPEFFLAHELAHQWWGQAVGWGSYHEQWLSEGFAQYFAVLYAQERYGDNAFAAALQHLRRWSLDQSSQGPVSLGYRLGHIRSDSRIFRAVVYNKGAAVLHMLRRLVGDEAFFRGLRRFYTEARFHKATTEQFRLAMEKETGRPLKRFFEGWIYGTAIPRLTYSYRIEPVPGGQNLVVLHVEQTGQIFDIPLTVTLQYADRRSVDVVVPITDRTVDARLALDGQLRSLEISKDDGLLAEVSKAP